MNNPERMISEQSWRIAKAFSDEKDRGYEAYIRREKLQPPVVFPCDLDLYVQAIHEFLNAEEIFPPKSIEKKLEQIRRDSKPWDRYPAKYKCIWAVIPFSENGNPLSEEEIAESAHITPLIVDPDGVTRRGFSFYDTFISRLLPAEIQGCSFEIEENETRESLEQKSSEAINKLKLILEGKMN